MNCMPEEKEMIENLRDAGCEEQQIREIMHCYRRGDSTGIRKQIDICRRKELERLHASQLCIDRLDYLKYRLDKNGKERGVL